MACTLTRQPNAEAALAGAMGGALFEGLVVAETVKAFANAGLCPELYSWRSHDGLEIDLLVPLAGKLLPVEIKSTKTPTARHARPLERFRAAAGDKAADQGLVVCRISEPRPLPNGNLAMSWSRFPAWLRERLV